MPQVSPLGYLFTQYTSHFIQPQSFALYAFIICIMHITLLFQKKSATQILLHFHFCNSFCHKNQSSVSFHLTRKPSYKKLGGGRVYFPSWIVRHSNVTLWARETESYKQITQMQISLICPRTLGLMLNVIFCLKGFQSNFSAPRIIPSHFS